MAQKLIIRDLPLHAVIGIGLPDEVAEREVRAGVPEFYRMRRRLSISARSFGSRRLGLPAGTVTPASSTVWITVKA